MFHVEQVERVFRTAGLAPSATFLEGARKHLEDVYKWNQVHGLTSVPPEDAAERHTLDSILPFKDVSPPTTLLDIGSGAGFPGIPLALWWPTTRVVLLEPLRKRRSFLETELARLDLDGETRGDPVEKVTDRFPFVTSRATLPWRILVSNAERVVGPGGTLVALLGPEQAPSKSDLDAILGAGIWRKFHVEQYRLPSGAPRVALSGLISAT